ncbi:MAG TPA: glycosyltransferase family 4 protein [Cyclobacteriaceae bacterium]|nr:glycosyltransferase family 4 protein [Cyclobacteriaceae bacterium]
MMRHILYLADPNSVHDIKWISFFAHENQNTCFLLSRISHYCKFENSPHKNDVLRRGNFHLLPPIHDFSIARFYRTIYEAYLIRKIILSNKIDVIHILYAEPNALWCLFRNYFSIPMIITTRGTDVLKTIPEAFKKKDVLNRLVSFAYKKAFDFADWITATSLAQIESIVKFSQRTSRLTIVRTGVDIEQLRADTSNSLLSDDSDPFLLFPRYIKPIYNHEFCLAAIALLPLKIKRDYKMVFVGKGEGDLEYQEKLENLMSQQSEIRFEFLGVLRQEAILELYKRASLVVMVPISDGSPVSGMEALLCGAKLILGPLEYDRDIFSHAVQLKQWDAKELADTIFRLLEGSVDGSKLPVTAEYAMDRSRNMKKMMEIYNMVC